MKESSHYLAAVNELQGKVAALGGQHAACVIMSHSVSGHGAPPCEINMQSIALLKLALECPEQDTSRYSTRHAIASRSGWRAQHVGGRLRWHLCVAHWSKTTA